MIIAGFGDTVASMYTFPLSMMEDDHRLARPSALKAVPLSSGALDVRGSTKNLRAGQIIGKRFVLMADTTPFSGSGSIGCDKNSLTVTGLSTAFLSQVTVGDLITVGSVSAQVAAVDSNTSLSTVSTLAPAADLDGEDYTITPAQRWNRLEISLDALRAATIAVGKTKLWALMRDGTYRWTWAKCVTLRAPEKVGNIHHCDVSLSFKADDPVWYSETAHTGSLSSGSNALTNAGNVLTPVIVRLTAVSAACTAFEFRNNDDINRVTFSGSVAAGKVFVIDGGKRSGKNDGAAAYSTLTIVGAGPWLYLPAGVSGIKWQSSTGGSPTATYEYYDAWEM